jgi:hypothetical protein
MPAAIVVNNYTVNFIKPFKHSLSTVNALNVLTLSVSKKVSVMPSLAVNFSRQKLMVLARGSCELKQRVSKLLSPKMTIVQNEIKLLSRDLNMRYPISGVGALQFISITRMAFNPENMKPVVVPYGINSISGVVKEGKTPVSRKVRLYRKDNGAFVAETKSGMTGYYIFKDLPAGLAFFVVSHDASGFYNAAVSDNIIA